MTEQELRTQLWDYVYGLMEPAEAAALEVRIKSDPHLARMYAETRLESDLLAGAARLEQPPILLTTRVAPATAATQRFRVPRSAGRAAWANWIAGLAAVLLIGLFAYGWAPQTTVAVATPDVDGLARHTLESYAAPAQPIVVDVTGPANAPEGLSNTFVIQTRDARNAPKPVELIGQVVDENGRTDFESQVTTDEKGLAKWTVPGSAIREHRRIVIKAKDQAADLPPVVAAMDVVADQFKAHLEVDREVSQPGETVFFRAVFLGENSRVESAPTDAEFVLLDPTGKPVPGSETKDTTVHGVAAGELVIPSNASEGQYEVLVRSPQREFDEQRIPLQVQREGMIASFGTVGQADAIVARSSSPNFAMNQNRATDKFKSNNERESENAAKASGKQADEVRSGNEGKPQAASAANAPALKVADAADAPAPPPGEPVLKPAPGATPPEKPAPGVKSEAGGKELAQGGPALRGNVEKKLAEQSPAIVRRGDPNAFGGGIAGKSGAAPSGGGTGGGAGGGYGATPAHNFFRVESQKEGLNLQLPADARGKRFLVEVERGGETIAKAETVADGADRKSIVGSKVRDAAGGSGDDLATAVVPLAPEIGGDLRVTVADEGKKVLYSGDVYRAPAQALVVQLGDVPQSFAPGQEVSLRLETKTEAGDQVSAVLGVRVVNADFLSYDNDAAPISGVQLSAKDAQRTERQLAAQSYSAARPYNDAAPSRSSASADGLAQAKADRGSANGTVAGRALELDRRTDFWDMNATQVTLGSNRGLVAEELEKFKEREDSYTAPRAPAEVASETIATDVRPLGKRLLVAGLLGLMAIGVMFVVRLPVRAWAWGPALVAATACLVLGIVRLAPPRADFVARKTTTLGESQNHLQDVEQPWSETLDKKLKSDAETRAEDSLGLQIAERETLEAVRGRDKADEKNIEEAAKNQVAQRDERKRASGNDGDDAAPRPAGGPATSAAPTELHTEKAAELQKHLADVKQQKGETMRRKAAEPSPAVPPATLLWNPRLITDDHGEARIKFRLPEQPGRYRVQVQGHADGRLGATEFVIQTQPPVVSAPAEPAAPPAAKPAADAPEPALPAKPQPPVESKE